jgi:hypothetical protein
MEFNLDLLETSLVEYFGYGEKEPRTRLMSLYGEEAEDLRAAVEERLDKRMDNKSCAVFQVLDSEDEVVGEPIVVQSYDLQVHIGVGIQDFWEKRLKRR